MIVAQAFVETILDDSCGGGSESPLASAHEQPIRRLSLDQAEALMEPLLDFRTPDDLKAWLAAQTPPI